MPGYETISIGENIDMTDTTGRSLMTDISESLFYLSSENRSNRKKEKLRQELVREHIESQKQTPSLLQSIAIKLTTPL
jgi:hypothetical protein